MSSSGRPLPVGRGPTTIWSWAADLTTWLQPSSASAAGSQSAAACAVNSTWPSAPTNRCAVLTAVAAGVPSTLSVVLV
jgi:hypothetical protein